MEQFRIKKVETKKGAEGIYPSPGAIVSRMS